MRNLLLMLGLLLANSVVNGADRIVTLAWDANPVTDNVTGYILEKAKGTDAFEELAKTGASELEASDTLSGGSGTYRYRVLASNAWGNSEPSSEVSVNTQVPGSPTNIRVKVIVDIETP